MRRGRLVNFGLRMATMMFRFAFRSGKLGAGGGFIRPNGSIVPVGFHQHYEAAKEEAIKKKIVKSDDAYVLEDDKRVFEALTSEGYVIVHMGGSSGTLIEYDPRAASKSYLKELADEFLTRGLSRFHVFTPTRDESAFDIEELEVLLGV